MNRNDRRRLARNGKRRTKPPVPHVKLHLPGEYACAARQVFLAVACVGGDTYHGERRGGYRRVWTALTEIQPSGHAHARGAVSS